MGASGEDVTVDARELMRAAEAGDVVRAAVPDPALVERLPAEYPANPVVNGWSNTGKRLWDRVLAVRVVQTLADGRWTLSEILRSLGKPSRETWNAWLMNVPALAEMQAVARHVAAHGMFDEALEAARNNAARPVNEVKNSATRTLIDTLKWAAGRLNPGEYGEKVIPAPSLTIRIETTLDVGDEAVAKGAKEETAIDMEEIGGTYTVRVGGHALDGSEPSGRPHSEAGAGVKSLDPHPRGPLARAVEEIGEQVKPKAERVLGRPGTKRPRRAPKGGPVIGRKVTPLEPLGVEVEKAADARRWLKRDA